MTRTRYSKEEKLRVVCEAIEASNIAAVARRHGLDVDMVYKWVRKYRELGEDAFQPKKRGQALSTQRALERENAKLKALIGEKELEIAILKDLLKNETVSLADRMDIAGHWIQRGYPARTVLRILEVSRSTYYYRITRGDKKRKPSPGRSPRGYAFDHTGRRIPDEKIKEWLIEAITGVGYAYGYLKLTHHLRREYGLIIMTP